MSDVNGREIPASASVAMGSTEKASGEGIVGHNHAEGGGTATLAREGVNDSDGGGDTGDGRGDVGSGNGDCL